MKPFLLPILALSLAACDSTTSSTGAQGTSSETQTILQALADSLLVVRVPDAPSTSDAAPLLAAGRGSAEGPWVPTAFERTTFAYWTEDPGGRNAYVSRVSARPEGDVLALYDTARHLTAELELRTRARWVQTGSDQQIDVAASTLESEVTTRDGFRFEWRRLEPADRESLRLDTLGIVSQYPFQQSILYIFEGGWNLVVPDASSRLLPLLRGGRIAGWLEPRDSTWTIPIKDFSRWRVRDLEGGVFLGRDLPRKASWEGDSVGLFFGTPRADSTGTRLVVPYRWRLLPGTVATAAEGGAPRLEGFAEGASFAFEGFAIPADSGSGVAVGSGGVHDGRLLRTRLTTSWAAKGSSGILQRFEYSLEVPGLDGIDPKEKTLPVP